ncbi:hypothetical protein BV898_07770 [Hypsibius exemplaris]|uniref:Uncharacterized protein n=1 Tax=Hypsibius exemplaris TaxID=2072580 RepID=A0A1W0WSL6_HYPEX|nr:hypothetical protein BV898_07770 [Hypsibius exemplaris]
MILCRICRKVLQRSALGSSVPSRRFAASALDIPVPRLKNAPIRGGDGIRVVTINGRHIRVAPWGPRPATTTATGAAVEPLKYEQGTATDVLAIDRSRIGRLEVKADQFQLISRIFKRFSIDNGEAERNPGIFALKPELVEDTLELFQECGWQTFTTDMVIYHFLLLRKVSAKDAIDSDSFSVTRSVLRNLLTELKIDDAAQQEPLSKVTESTAAFLTLTDLRMLAIREYIQTLFPDPANVQRIFKIIMKSSASFRPVKRIQRQIQYIITDFGIPKEKFLSYGVILRKTDRELKEFLERYPTFYGLDIRTVAMQYPKIVSSFVECFAEKEAVLKKHGIATYQLASHLHVMSLAADTMDRRLTAIENDPELFRFKNEPDYLSLAVNYNEALRRLAFLQSMKVTGISVKLLTCQRERFQLTLARGSLIKPADPKSCFTKHYHLLPVSAWLKIPSEKLRSMIREQLKVSIPLSVSDSNEVQQILDCFKANGITKEQFLRCMSLVLYPARVVEKYMAEAMADPSLAGRRDQSNFLHYVLYAIEKQTNFDGPQAWSFAHAAGAAADDLLDAENMHTFLDVHNTISQTMGERLAEEDALLTNAEATNVAEKKEHWFD